MWLICQNDMVWEHGLEYITFHVQNNIILLAARSGGRLNKKDGLTRYGDSHVKDKTS